MTDIPRKKRQLNPVLARRSLSVAALFSALLIGSAGFGLMCGFRPELWADWGWLARDISNLLCSLVAASAISRRAAPSVRLAVGLLAIWRGAVLVVNAVGLPPSWSDAYAVGTLVTYWVYVLRVLYARRITTAYAGDAESHAIYVPLHSYWGVLQAAFLPWRHPLYESRMLTDGDTVWLVHRGRFISAPWGSVRQQVVDSGAAFRPLKKPLSPGAVAALNRLVGRKAVPCVRDCHRLEVG